MKIIQALKRAFSSSYSIANVARAQSPSVWSTFTPLAIESKAINLGQGFPNEGAPSIILESIKEALSVQAFQQYTLAPGLPLLRDVLLARAPPSLGQLDSQKHILITVGATEALFLMCTTLLEPNDEAIVIEPYYDCYAQAIRFAGATPRFVSLQPSTTTAADWSLDFKALEASVNSKTKMILINNPQNVPGKVYTREELEALAAFARRHRLTIVADEVYDCLVLDGKHTPIAQFAPSQTVTIGSAGKSFSMCGLKIGWAVSSNQRLLERAKAMRETLTFCVSTPLQAGVAMALAKADGDDCDYWQTMRSDYLRRRDHMISMLRSVNLTPIVPQGTYFVLADMSSIDADAYYDANDDRARDWQLATFMARTIGVAAIPPSAFYGHQSHVPSTPFARFCFAKSEATINAAGERMKAKLSTYQRV